jgi:hypothetical protein
MADLKKILDFYGNRVYSQSRIPSGIYLLDPSVIPQGSLQIPQ